MNNTRTNRPDLATRVGTIMAEATKHLCKEDTLPNPFNRPKPMPGTVMRCDHCGKLWFISKRWAIWHRYRWFHRFTKKITPDDE